MKKVIICSISIGLVLLLGITALVLALIPVNKNSVIEKPNAVYIINEVTWDTTQQYYDLMDYKDDGNGNKKDQPKIDEIFRLFNSIDFFSGKFFTKSMYFLSVILTSSSKE